MINLCNILVGKVVSACENFTRMAGWYENASHKNSEDIDGFVWLW
jgi:hypothetical protein